MAHETPLPRELASRSVRIVRPRDGHHVYRHPREQFARLARAGVLMRVARGYYAIPPTEALGDLNWRPTPEAVALGIGIADYGRDRVALSGISAARLQGVPPRALAIGVVSAPVRRPPVRTTIGPVAFWHRDLDALDTQKARTELAVGWAATAEQALLDLAGRPNLGGLSPVTAAEAMWDLARRVDWNLIHRLSELQRHPGAYARALWVCSGLVSGDAPPPRLRRPVPRKELMSWSDSDPRAYGIVG